MLLFELYYRRQSRWLIVYSLVTIHILLMGLMSSGLTSVWQFIISIFTDELAAIIIFPILFIIVIADLVSANYSDRFTDCTLTRYKSRGSWLLSKIGVLFASAFIFTLVNILIAFLLAICIGFPIYQEWESHSLYNSGDVPLTTLAVIAAAYTCTLTAFGTFVVMLSLLIKSARKAGWIGAILSLAGYACWIEESFRPWLKWSPSCQIIFLSPFLGKYTGNLLTMHWFFFYNAILFLLSLLVCIFVIRKTDLSKTI